MKPQNGEKPVGGERAQKQTFVAFAIVDELTANGAMHLLLGIRKVPDDNARPVFTETVGKNSILEDRPAQVDDRLVLRVQGANALDVNGLSCRIPNRYLDVAKRLAGVGAQMINQIWLPP